MLKFTGLHIHYLVLKVEGPIILNASAIILTPKSWLQVVFWLQTLYFMDYKVLVKCKYLYLPLVLDNKNNTPRVFNRVFESE